MASKYYVYAHIDPYGQVFYIGKGTGTRAFDSEGRTKSWKDYVKAFKDKGLIYSSMVLHICETEQEALDLEELEIVTRLKAGQPLVNKMHKKSTANKFLLPSESLEGTYEAIDIAEAFRSIRKLKRITIEKLARYADVSRDCVLRFENKKTDMRLGTFIKLLKLMNVKLLIQPNIKHCISCQSPLIREKMNAYVCDSCGKSFDRPLAEYKEDPR